MMKEEVSQGVNQNRWKKLLGIDIITYIEYINVLIMHEYITLNTLGPVTALLGLRSASGSGFGIMLPVFLDTRTFDPSSRYLLEVFVGSLCGGKVGGGGGGGGGGGAVGR
jgi:hypothetical protein